MMKMRLLCNIICCAATLLLCTTAFGSVYTTKGNLSTNFIGNTYHYNPLNQLISTVETKSTTTYSYYANGLQANSALSSNTNDIFYDYYTRDKQLINRFSNHIHSSYLMTNHRILRQSTGVQIYLYNRHNSVMGIAKAQEAKAYQYTATGRSLLLSDDMDTSLTNNPIRYAGYWFSPFAQCYILPAREYSPNLHSFLQIDSYALDQHTLQNGYFYGNNPLMGKDTNGHFFEGIIARIMAEMRLEIDNASIIGRTEEIQPNHPLQTTLKLRLPSQTIRITNKNKDQELVDPIIKHLRKAGITRAVVERSKFFSPINFGKEYFHWDNVRKFGHERIRFETENGDTVRVEYESKGNILKKILGRAEGHIQVKINQVPKTTYYDVHRFKSEETNQVFNRVTHKLTSLQNVENSIPKYKLYLRNFDPTQPVRLNCQVFIRTLLPQPTFPIMQ